MRILVTGGSGLVGRYVVDELATDHTVEVVDLKPPHRDAIHWHRVDLLDFEPLRAIVSGFDAVVHLAGIPHPLNDPPERVFRVNAVGTFHVLEACERARIPKFVFMSSESTLGFAFARTDIRPEYVPVDEQHPLRPQDPYGMSKVTGEQLCEGYSRRSGMRTTCLRAPWIWVPEEKERTFYRQLISEYSRWPKNLWAFIHVLDVAEAVKLALRYSGSNVHDIFFICADENWTGKESVSLVREFFPDTRIAKGFGGTQSLISNEKAKRLLQFRPRYSRQDIVRD